MIETRFCRPSAGPAAELDLAGEHDVQAVAGLALVEEDVALCGSR
jgi:hypothetical protein